MIISLVSHKYGTTSQISYKWVNRLCPFAARYGIFGCLVLLPV